MKNIQSVILSVLLVLAAAVFVYYQWTKEAEKSGVAERTIQGQKERISALEKEVKTLHGTISRVEQENTALSAAIAEKEGIIVSLRQRLEALSAQNDRLKAETTEKESTLENIRKKRHHAPLKLKNEATKWRC